MSLDEAIGRLEKLIAEVRQASLIDDKTPLGSLLALRQEGRLINAGLSKFRVVVFGDLNDFKSLNDEFGHEAGNIAIRSVGETLQESIAKANNARITCNVPKQHAPLQLKVCPCCGESIERSNRTLNIYGRLALPSAATASE